MRQGFKLSSLFSLIATFSFGAVSLVFFFASMEKGQLVVGLMMLLIFGIFLITDAFPKYLEKIDARFFSITVSLFSGCLYLINLPIFARFESFIKIALALVMAIIAVFTGVGLSYPFRKLFKVKKS